MVTYNSSSGNTSVVIAALANVPVYITVTGWVAPSVGSSVQIFGHCSTGSPTGPAAPAGIPIVATFQNTTPPIMTAGDYADETTDSSGNFTFWLPASYVTVSDTYHMTIVVNGTTTIGGNTYSAGDAGYSTTFFVPPASYPTVVNLALYNGTDNSAPLATTVHPGQALGLQASVTINTATGTPVLNAGLNGTVKFATGTTFAFAMNTGTTGLAWYDLTSLVAAATSTNEGFGTWTVTVAYPGQSVANGPGAEAPEGFYPSASFINVNGDSSGYYYDNGQFASQLHGATGTPFIPGAYDASVETAYPRNAYGMVDPGDVYGVSYWGTATEPPSFNAYSDPDNLIGSGYGNTYVDGNVTDRSQAMVYGVQEDQNPNFYRPNAIPGAEQFFGPGPYPGYQGDPQFNNYGNQYVDTNVADRSQPMVFGLQEAQNPNFYRNSINDPQSASVLNTYYGPINAGDDVLTNPLFTQWINEPNGKPGGYFPLDDQQTSYQLPGGYFHQPYNTKRAVTNSY